MRTAVLVLSIVTSALAQRASAQSFNLDIGDPSSAPQDIYGGAAESPGRWQAIDLGPTPIALVDVTGGGGAVTLSASVELASTALTGVGPADDDARLLEDFVALDASATTLTFDGLAAGRYQVWTYAFAVVPDAITYVSVNDDTQAVAGPWSGGFEVFVTHALHEVELAGEPLVVSVVGVDHGVLSGLQLVRLPDDPPPEGDPQGFNLDGGAQLGEPSPSYGAAAGQAGYWMPLSFAIENPVKLVGLDGVVSGVTLTANLPYGPAFNEHPGPRGDDEKLLEDYLDLHSTPGSLELRGVPPGDYLVYTYAWAPDDARYLTFVTIGEESQTIGGQWPGALTQGITHARHKVTVPPSGRLTIRTFGTKGTLNGIQIVPVGDDPVEPGPETVETAEVDDVYEPGPEPIELVETVEPVETVETDGPADPGPETGPETDEGPDADAGPETGEDPDADLAPEVAEADAAGTEPVEPDRPEDGAAGREDGCGGGRSGVGGGLLLAIAAFVRSRRTAAAIDA